MRWHTGMIGLALMSLALGACASDKAATTTTATASTTFTPQQLSGVLLTTSDLGSGWTETQHDVFATRQPENPSIDPSLWCLAGTIHPSYVVRQQAWTNADVEQYFTSVKSVVAACMGVTWKDGGGNSYTLHR